MLQLIILPMKVEQLKREHLSFLVVPSSGKRLIAFISCLKVVMVITYIRKVLRVGEELSRHHLMEVFMLLNSEQDIASDQ